MAQLREPQEAPEYDGTREAPTEEQCTRNANRVWNDCHHETSVEIQVEFLRQLE